MKPLSGVTVLDLSRVLAGPYCTMLLGDYGADVIKVERPGSGDDTRAWGPPFVKGESTYFLSVNRNKRSIAVDLKHAEGKRIIRDLASRADVLVENFSPGTLDDLVLSPAELMAANPKLIVCSISGFGQTGPDRDLPGFDLVMQARGGIMSVTGRPDAPPSTVGLAIVDLFAGLHALSLILAALHERETTGKGRIIDLGLLDSHVSILTHLATSYLNTGNVPQRRGNTHNNIVPYQTFQTKDGYVNISVGNDGLWQKFCAVLGLKNLAADARFTTNAQRVQHRDELIPRLEAVIKERSSADLVKDLSAAHVPVATVQDMAQVCADPQVLAREMIAHMPHPLIGDFKTPASPGFIDGKKPEALRAPPLLGQHTDEILREFLKITAEQIANLRASGAIS